MSKNKKVIWCSNKRKKGQFLFTFDGNRIFNLFRDYPHELTKEQKRIFDEENPYWANFFKERNKSTPEDFL